MNPKHLHTPLSTRARCPVCHETVYSRAGIHPQCAIRQADPPRPKVKEPKPDLPADHNPPGRDGATAAPGSNRPQARNARLLSGSPSDA
jgi:hypothetical protein